MAFHWHKESYTSRNAKMYPESCILQKYSSETNGRIVQYLRRELLLMAVEAAIILKFISTEYLYRYNMKANKMRGRNEKEK